MTKIKISVPDGRSFVYDSEKAVCKYDWNCDGQIIGVRRPKHEFRDGICECGAIDINNKTCGVGITPAKFGDTIRTKYGFKP